MISSLELTHIPLATDWEIKKIDDEIKFYQVKYNHINSKLHNISKTMPFNFLWQIGKFENPPFWKKYKRLHTN